MCTCSKADRDAKNMDGKTALEVALLNEQKDVIEALGGSTAQQGQEGEQKDSKGVPKEESEKKGGE